MHSHHHDHTLSLERGETHTHHHLGHAGGGTHFLWALVATLFFAGVEAFSGWWSGSLALIADAGHMLTDSTSLGLAAAAAWLAKRPPSPSHSYGLVRAEVLAALVNSVAMLALVVFIMVEAIDRFGQPRAIQGGVVLVVAGIGLLVNLIVAWALSHGEETLNSRAALLHVLGDLLGSVAAIASGLVILYTGWTPIDPILSAFVAVLIGFSAVRLLKETIHVLMEGVPPGVDIERVGHDLAFLPGVVRVHDLHVWTLSSGTLALSAHMELHRLDDWPDLLDQARKLLSEHHNIRHVTLQPEALCAVPLHPAEARFE